MVAKEPKRPTINTVEEAIEFLTRHARLFVSGLMDRWWVRSKDDTFEVFFADNRELIEYARHERDMLIKFKGWFEE